MVDMKRRLVRQRQGITYTVLSYFVEEHNVE
jgi:hypothetical protein